MDRDFRNLKREVVSGILNVKKKQDKGCGSSKRYEEFRRYLENLQKITTKMKIKIGRKKKKKRTESHLCMEALLVVPP